MRNYMAIGLVGVMLGLCPVAAQAADDLVPLASAMPAGRGAAPMPAGFLSFCLRFADQCATDKSKPNIVALTPDGWDKIQEVNEAVNRAIVPEDDLAHYGRAEYWTIPTDGRGDCEDYALTKRAALIAEGFPARALRMAVVKTSQGERHAVLTVATDHGAYVLDNLSRRVLSWDDTDYQWIERQDPNNEMAWVWLTAPVLAAASGQHG